MIMWVEMKNLKEKYKSKVLGFELDKDRIPGIDRQIFKDNQDFKIGKFKFFR